MLVWVLKGGLRNEYLELVGVIVRVLHCLLLPENGDNRKTVSPIIK
jgi:hypothetical protein